MKAQAVFITAPRTTEIREVEVPDPEPDQVQVRCVANGICMAEVSVFTGTEPHYPATAGHEGVGVVTKVGARVQNLQEGDWVATGRWATAENLPAAGLARLSGPPPDPAVFLIEPCACVVTALYSYDLTAGDRALVLGAGFMGLLNVQALAHCPLAELVVSEIRPDNLALAEQFGATEVLNPTTPEGQARLEALQQQPFDLVVEAAGVEETVQMAGPLTRSGGRLSIFAWHHTHTPRLLDLGVWHMRGLKVMNSAPGIGRDHNINNMQRAVALLERGVFDLGKLVTHRHALHEVQTALEIAAERPAGYRKGVLLFS
jgi:threonine dehydrogenase-like Zn-dependent dehydrogenase